MEHTNQVIIQALTEEYADYPKNAWHYDRQYKMIENALRLQEKVSLEEILNEILLQQEEVISSPIRFNGVHVNRIREVFENHGIKISPPF